MASDKQATDILLLDIRGICSFADYFVMCTGETERQINTICEEISQTLKAAGVHPGHREGDDASGWVLLDYGDVVVHVFSPPQRQYYHLEGLWAAGKPLLRMQ